MRIVIEIKIRVENERKAMAIVEALKPDNIDIPVGMRLEVSQAGNEIFITAECEHEKILTCRSTVDEILMLVQRVDKILSD
ncbi:MAG: KEOPS complex subunit Pcc1 [Sulfolobales archaeon]